MERNGKGKRKEEGKKEGKKEKLSCKHCEKRVRKIYTILFHTKNYFGDIVMICYDSTSINCYLISIFISYFSPTL